NVISKNVYECRPANAPTVSRTKSSSSCKNRRPGIPSRSQTAPAAHAKKPQCRPAGNTTCGRVGKFLSQRRIALGITFSSPETFCYSVFYMADNLRSFQAGPDPFGRMWNVEFRWLQTGISIRHADTV